VVAVERAQAHGAPVARAVALRKAPGGADTAALVAAMSALVGDLADQIAVMLRGGA
jgi:hypothetical protein